MDIAIVLIYAALGYWATGETVYANMIRIGTASNLFYQRLAIGLVFGFILIPIAILKCIFFKRE